MGQTINSVPQMMAYAGDLKRAAAQQAGSPDVARKLQQSADALEKSALAKVGQTSPLIGKLLDLLA
jgi:hypothetical protein